MGDSDYHECDECKKFEHQILSLTGQTKGYTTIDEAKEQGLFHPNCIHWFEVTDKVLDEYEGLKGDKPKENNIDIIVKGNELGENLSGEILRDKAEEYYNKNLANKTFENKNLGIVKFSQGGFKKPRSASKDQKKLKILPVLPEIIMTGEVSEPIPDRYNRPNVKAFYTITKTIQFEGEPKKVRVTIREDNNGKLYYDHTFAIPQKSI